MRMAKYGYVLLPALLAAWFATSAHAGEIPQRSMLEQDGKKVPFYMLGGRLYREIDPLEARLVKPGIPVAFVVKLREARDGRVYPYGQSFELLRLELGEGVALPPVKPGDNLVLGAMRRPDDGGDPTFEIQTAAPMPGDLEIFALREKDLRAAKEAAPEKFYLLADWLERARTQAQITDESVYRRYREERDRMYRDGLKRDVESAAPEADAVAKRARRILAFLDRVGEAPDGTASSLLAVTLYPDLLDAAPVAMRAIRESKPLKEGDARRVSALSYLQIADLAAELFPDDDALVLSLVRRAARTDPGLDAAVRRMKKRGYVLYKGEWMTRAEQSAAERKAAESAEAAREKAAEAERRKQATKRAAETKERLSALERGEGYEDGMITVDALLGMEKGAGLAELAASLGKLPEDVARNGLFRGAAWHWGEKRNVLLEAALASEERVLKMDAVAILAAEGSEESIRLVVDRLAREKDAGIMKDMAETVWHAPGAAGVKAMILILARTGIPPEAREAAHRRLVAETGQEIGMDAFAWKRWWAKNGDAFKRKPRTDSPVAE